jgi:hypothetical protein
MIIYLSRPAIAEREPNPAVGTMMRRYPRIKRAGCPSSVLSCTAWGFSCLANYSASGELLPRLFTLARALLPKNRRCFFCDTLRHRNFQLRCPRVLRGMPPYGVRTFLQQAASGSPAIICHRPIIYHNRVKKKTPKSSRAPQTRASCDKRRSFKSEMAPSKRKS